MKVVIDIPDEIYEVVRECEKNCERYCMDVTGGKPLPKGHGDLIDRKSLMNRPYETGGFVEWYDEIKHAPTIIEAEQEEDE